MKINIKQIELETAAAIMTASDHANLEWKREAEACVSILARRGHTFTSDDVWEMLGHSGLTTRNNSALGGIFREAYKDGFIRPTGEYRKSVRRSRHRAPLTVWKPIRYQKRFWVAR